MSTPDHFTLAQVDDRLWVVYHPIGMANYDFDFGAQFPCRHPATLSQPIKAIARLGSASSYEQRFADFSAMGVTLVNDPESYLRGTQLPYWYPCIEELTPRSLWFEQPPSAKDVEAHFSWPVFVKGERQTNRHSRRQSIIESREQFETVMSEWSIDPVLAWQRVTVREFVPLRSVGESSALLMPAAFEFRTFWWHEECVGVGKYWRAYDYDWTPAEAANALAVAREAARRLKVPFLVIDLAQTVSGKWIIIECNDGQESGYAGVQPRAMWNRIMELGI